MPNSAVTMLTHTASMSYTGENIKADGYYGYTDGLHTISFKLNGPTADPTPGNTREPIDAAAYFSSLRSNTKAFTYLTLED